MVQGTGGHRILAQSTESTVWAKHHPRLPIGGLATESWQWTYSLLTRQWAQGSLAGLLAPRSGCTERSLFMPVWRGQCPKGLWQAGLQLQLDIQKLLCMPDRSFLNAVAKPGPNSSHVVGARRANLQGDGSNPSISCSVARGVRSATPRVKSY